MDTVEFVLENLSTDVYLCMEGNRRTKLESVLKLAKKTKVPDLDVRTLNRWFNHDLKFGDVPAIARKYRRQKASKGARRFSMVKRPRMFCLSTVQLPSR